jgi:hypothetical protein
VLLRRLLIIENAPSNDELAPTPLAERVALLKRRRDELVALKEEQALLVEEQALL